MKIGVGWACKPHEEHVILLGSFGNTFISIFGNSFYSVVITNKPNTCHNFHVSL